MNDTFENQKEKLLAIKQEVSLLHQQVNYLLRNKKALELLDLDVLMNRTHTIYDMLCSIDSGDTLEDEDFPLDAEALSGIIGGMMPEAAPEAEEEAPVSENPMEEPKEEVLAQVEAEPAEETIVAPAVELEMLQPLEEKTIVEEPVPSVEEEKPEEKPLGDEFGFFFRFEDVPEEKPKEEQPKAESADTSAKVVHVMEAVPEEEIPERDRVHGEDLVKDNPLEMPKMDDEKPVSFELENERQGSGQVSDFFESDDAEFELTTTETLGEKMMGEDHSLAARLQQNPVRDLRSVIGMNDKFLFVNELFGGSMEKYSKSIENLNDLKTLNGAMIYLNELKIELAWNSSNEAYQKLKELVSRKFE